MEWYFKAFPKLHWPHFYQSAKPNYRSGIHPSMHQNCYHQVIFRELNLKIEYLLTYARGVWDYGKAQTDLTHYSPVLLFDTPWKDQKTFRGYRKATPGCNGFINRGIDQSDWADLFLDKNINEQIILFNWTILKIFHDFQTN